MTRETNTKRYDTNKGIIKGMVILNTDKGLLSSLAILDAIKAVELEKCEHYFKIMLSPLVGLHSGQNQQFNIP